MGFNLTSAKTGQGIEDGMEKLVDVVYGGSGKLTKAANKNEILIYFKI